MGNGSQGYSGDGGAATNAALYIPAAVAVDSSGNIFIADHGNQRIRKVDVSGLITTVAGNGMAGYSGNGGAATNATLDDPLGIAVDMGGNIFFTNPGSDSVQKVGLNGIITTVAGNCCGSSFSGDGGAATNARLSGPIGVAVDASGNLFIADSPNHRIRKVNAKGIISTVAGNGAPVYSGDGGAATNASLNNPYGVAVDALGNLFVADQGNQRIRKVDVNGIITTVAGNGTADYSGDGGPATNAGLYPFGVAVDTSGNLFIADHLNQRIRKVDRNGIITTVAGNGKITTRQSNTFGTYSGDGGLATNAGLSNPVGVAVDSSGNLFIADSGNDVIRKASFFAGLPNLTLTNISAANQGNYDVIVINAYGSIISSVATLTVLPSLSVAWRRPPQIVYGTVLSSAQLNATANIPGTFVYSPPLGTVLPASSGQMLSVTFTPADSVNYQPYTTNVLITVQPAPLTVIAGNAIRGYGTANPVFAGTISGFANGDTNSAVAGQPAFSTTSTIGSNVGAYPIVPSVGTLIASNYMFATFVPGSLTVTPATLTVAANNVFRNYGASNPSFIANVTGFVNGDTASVVSGQASFNTSATAGSSIGTYSVFPALGTLHATNYTFGNFAGGTLTVNPAPLTVTANNATRLYGDANPSFTATITGFVNGDNQSVISGSSSLTTSATQTSPPGAYPIMVAQGSLAAANYLFGSFVNGTLNVVGLSLTVVTNGLGGVLIDPAQTNYADGSQVVLTATPFTNWVFAGWTGAVVTNTNVVTVVISSNVLMAANFLPTYPVTLVTNGQGTLVISPAQDLYVSNTVVTATASPANGWGFAGWSGSETTNGLSISFPVNGAMNLTGTFLPVWQITATQSGQGNVAATPNGPYLDGTTVSLTATPANGWTFSGWTGDLTTAANPLNVTLKTNLGVMAVFRQLFTVTGQVVGQGQVSITPSQANYVDGTTVSVEATPAAGWAFTGWSGALSGQANPASLLVTGGNQSVTATFKHLWNFTATAGAGGTVGWTPQQTNYLDGTSVMVTAVASNGFAFSQWTGAASGHANPLSLTLSGNEQVQASFTDIQPPVVTIAIPAAGTVTNGYATLSGTLSDNVGVATAQWSFNGGAWRSISNIGVGTFGVTNVQLKIGTNVFVVEATDAAGNVGSNMVQVVYAPNRILMIGDALPVQEGERAVFALSLVSGGEVSGINVALAYDTNYLADPQVVWSAAAGLSINTVNTQTLGLVQAVVSLPGATLPAGTQALATVSFRARSVPFSLNSIVTPSIQDIASQSGAGFVSGNATQPGSVQITERLIIGDNNANETLDIGDAVIIEQMLVGIMAVRSWDVALNDLNGNGVLDSGDVIKVLRAVVGLDPQPAGVEPGPVSGGFARSLKLRSNPQSSTVVNSNDIAVLQFPDGPLPTVGQPYHVVVYASRLAGPISGLSFQLSYPNNALQLALNQVGNLIPGQTVPLWNLTQGQASLAVIGASPWPNTNGVASTFTFLPLPGLTNAVSWPLTLNKIQVTGNGFDIRSLDPVNAVVEGMNGPLASPVLTVTGLDRAAGLLGLTVTASIGTTIVVQTSTNLINWLPYGSPVNGQGVNVAVPVSLPISANEPTRFFRLEAQ